MNMLCVVLVLLVFGFGPITTLQQKAKSSFWIGGFKNTDDLQWASVSSLPIATTFPWGKNTHDIQQDSGDNQNCKALKYFKVQNKNGYADIYWGKRGFICEKRQNRIVVCTNTCGHGDCDASTNTCTCHHGWGGKRCHKNDPRILPTTKNNDPCILPTTKNSCKPGFTLVASQCLWFSPNKASWTQARAACEENEASLVMPVNFNALVDYMLKKHLYYYQYWVGASNQATGNYNWLNGCDIDDSIWYAGYDKLPFGNYDNDSCVKLNLQSSTSGIIADWDSKCSGNNQNNYRFICQED